MYKCMYNTPEGFSNMIMNSDEKDLEVFRETRTWLDIYFSGKVPDFTPKYRIANLTPFRKEVIDILNSIKYGETLTYNDIAKIISENRKMEKCQHKQYEVLLVGTLYA